MSDDAAKHFTAQGSVQEEGQPPRSTTLVITMQPNGNLEITGPLGNAILCYGILEKARSHIQQMHLMAELQHSQASKGGIGGLLKRMNGG